MAKFNDLRSDQRYRIRRGRRRYLKDLLKERDINVRLSQVNVKNEGEIDDTYYFRMTVEGLEGIFISYFDMNGVVDKDGLFGEKGKILYMYH